MASQDLTRTRYVRTYNGLVHVQYLKKLGRNEWWEWPPGHGEAWLRAMEEVDFKGVVRLEVVTCFTCVVTRPPWVHPLY